MSQERTFIVAVRRDRRGDIPGDWVEIVRRLDGVIVEPSSPHPIRIVVRASLQAAERIRQVLNGFVLVEESIPHSTAIHTKPR